MGYTMVAHRIKWDYDWIRANFNEYATIQDLNKAYNTSHNVDLCYRTFKGVCQRMGLKKSNLTKEQDAFIRLTYPICGTIETTRLYNETFGTNKTCEQMRSLIGNRKLTIADDDTYTKLRNTKPIKYKVGETTKGWKEPYVKVGTGKFVAEGKWVYEQAYGKVPSSYMVIHLDGDMFHNDLDNLAAIPRKYNAWLIRNNLYSKEAPLTRAAILWCELQERIKNSKKGVDNIKNIVYNEITS